MARKRKFTDQELINAVKKSFSLSQVLRELKLVAAGGNFQTIKNLIEKLDINISHFTGKGWNTGKRHRPPKEAEPLETILIKNRFFNTYHLKNRLFKEDIKEKKCEKCGNAEWLGQPIALELEHIDGDRSNNKLENLQILCPNCHAQTPTYRGKKLKKSREKQKRQEKKYYCECSKEITRKSSYCRECAIKYREQNYKIDWPSKEELLRMLRESNYTKVGKKLGVSDNAIRKHLKNDKK